MSNASENLTFKHGVTLVFFGTVKFKIISAAAGVVVTTGVVVVVFGVVVVGTGVVVSGFYLRKVYLIYFNI